MSSALKIAAAALTVVGAMTKLGRRMRGGAQARRLELLRLQRETGLSEQQVQLYAGIEKHEGFAASDAHKAFAHLRHKEVA
jgi:hypothetical protein